ncbi:MAG TPA: YihY/virulence factor BrkB family protein [Solirubrobacteraceae bacterium]|nr:YihY/virulence factor BrkB family protein [Solirubrobacteraceae bacterium]
MLAKRTWLGTVKRTVREFRDDNLTDWAAALTYYAVLSLFPAFIALISILGLVVDPQTITRVITDVVSQLGPASAVDTFKEPIEQIANNRSAALLGLIIGVATALWTASGYVGAFMRASNAIYERDEGRPFYLLRPLQILVTLVLVLMAALVVLSLVATGPVAKAVGDAIGLGDAAVTAWNIAKWPVLLIVVMLMLAILYWSSPNAKPAGFRWISPGAVLAVLVWIAGSVAFAFYVANFGSYNKTYGTLAGVIVFLVWMWLTNVAVLLGAELNAETERGREIEEGVPGAEEEIQAPYRRAPKDEEENEDAQISGARSR